MPQSTLYVETTVIGHLVGRILADPVVAGRQTVTRNWWPTAIRDYRLFVSRLVADECAAGDVEFQAYRERYHACRDRVRLPKRRLRAADHLHS